MATKTYDFDFGERRFRVTAEAEGDSRYMVRMAETSNGCAGYIRIGYLTGALRHWLVEHGAGRALLSTPAHSAKAACFALARWALTQPGFAQPPLQSESARPLPATARVSHATPAARQGAA